MSFVIGGKARFIITTVTFAFSISLLGTGVALRWSFISEPSVFTGLLVSIVTIAPFIYKTFVFVPVLEIRRPNVKEIRKPILYVFDIEELWGYLRLEVWNHGLEAARNAIVKVRVIKRPTKDGQECKAPSWEYNTFMTLTWAGEPKGPRTIPPGSNAFIDVVFSPYREREGRLEKISAKWHGESKWGPLIAWFAEPEAIRIYVKEFELIHQRRHRIITRGYEIRLQSGLVRGEYEIEIGVFCENIRPVIKRFRLVIDEDWDNTDIKEAD